LNIYTYVFLSLNSGLSKYYKRITTNETHVKSVIECAALAKMSFYNEPLPMEPQRPNAFYFKDGLCWLSAVSGPKGAYLESAQPLPKNLDSAYGLRGCLGNFLSVVTTNLASYALIKVLGTTRNIFCET